MNTILVEKEIQSQVKIALVKGDITTEETDAIVNAAGKRLSHGGGVAAAIARKAGSELVHESQAWVAEHGPVGHEKPAHTTAGDLPSKYVIHAVGPIWGSGDEDHKLHQAIYGALQRASELELESLSLPAISTGIFGFPMRRAADIHLRTLLEYLDEHPESSLKQVRIVLYDQEAVQAFQDSWQEIVA